MNEEIKSFEQLKKENASCFEYAWNGFIRIYEDGEERCECKDCIAMGELNKEFNVHSDEP